MIFAICFAVWIIFLTESIWHFAIPAICLALRGSYLSRRIIPPFLVWLTAGVIYLVCKITIPEQALMIAARSFFILALIEHILGAIRSSGIRLKGFQYDLANTIHISSRSLRVSKERIADLSYSKRLRIQSERNLFKKLSRRLSINLPYVVSIGIEMMQLVTTLHDTISARGDFPHPSSWKETHRLQTWLYAGDFLIIILALVGAMGAVEGLYPAFIGEQSERIWLQAYDNLSRLSGIENGH